MAASDWIEFWDSKHSIYVNARHAKAHFQRIARDLLAYAPQGGVMLDYGCGEARSAELVAAPLERLILCEGAPNVRAAIAARFAGNAKIAIRKPEDAATMPARSIDVIVLHSVAQYLSQEELVELLALFRRLLKPGGLLVLGDIIPRGASALGDARALVRFGRGEGFLFGALFGLARTYFSDYWRLRRSLGLARHDEAEFLNMLETAGFSAERARTNIGHNERRMTFLAHAR